MSKRIYILDEYVSSAKNGIGIYLQQFFHCMKSLDVDVCWIVFNSKYKEFCIKQKGDYTKMYFPVFPGKNFADCSSVISRFFRLHITDTTDNVFFINHFPLNELMKMIKRFYPLSKLVYVIHDMAWSGVFLGNIKKLKRLKSSILNPDEKRTDDYLLSLLWKEKEMLDMADKVVCLSQDTADILTGVYALSKLKICLIPNGLKNKRKSFLPSHRKEEIKKGFYLHKDEKILLFVGRVTQAKGYNELMSAFRLIIKTCPTVRLVVAGAISPLMLSLYSDLASHIIYTGHISGAQLEKWYQIADVGVIPSYTEQCGYVGIEMMMYRLPIVASDGFGMRNMFQDGMNALVASVGDYKSSQLYVSNLAETVIRLLASETLANELRINAGNIYTKRYTILCMKKRYKELIESLD